MNSAIANLDAGTGLRRAGALLLGIALATGGASAAILQVGVGARYATIPAAVASAASGDILEIAPGTYTGAAAVAVINKSLTLRGVGGRPVLDVAGYTIPNGKAILVAAGADITVENLEFRNAAVPDHNGAGIRPEGAKLTVRSCYFHDNENGIQGGVAGSEILVESCEFEHNGHGDGLSHNLYISAVGRFTFRFNYSHRGNAGHLLKTRAQDNYILYNRITDETGGAASYEVDVPQGGLTFLVGNVIEQSATTQNPTVIAYAEEGSRNATNRLYLANNTILNHRATAVFVHNASAEPAVLINNLLIGPGSISSGAVALTNNLVLDPNQVRDASAIDLRLTATSRAIDWGAVPGIQDGFDLMPVSEYLHPMRGSPRQRIGAPDVGAFECTDSDAVFLHFTEVGVANGMASLRWLGNPAMIRVLESSTAPTSSDWVGRATNQPGTGAGGFTTLPIDGASTYFRLRGLRP